MNGGRPRFVGLYCLLEEEDDVEEVPPEGPSEVLLVDTLLLELLESWELWSWPAILEACSDVMRWFQRGWVNKYSSCSWVGDDAVTECARATG